MIHIYTIDPKKTVPFLYDRSNPTEQLFIQTSVIILA